MGGKTHWRQFAEAILDPAALLHLVEIKKIQLCTIMAEEELEIHLGTARAGPISLLMMPLLFLATAHHLVASGQ